MQKFYVIACLSFLAGLASGKAQTADSIAVPAVWLRADQGGATPTVWPDRSGHRRDAIAVPGEEPAAGGVINFNRTRLFDGLNDYMKIPYSPENAAAVTMIAVFQPVDTVERGVWGAEKATTRNMMLTTRRALGPEATLNEYARGENRPILSSVVQFWTRTAVVNGNGFLAVGSAGKERGQLPYKGSIAELMVYDRALGFLERLQAESYLAIKYGITLPGGNYVNSKEKIVWHGEQDQKFANRVAGIGRDDAFGLYQKQSASTREAARLLVLSAGPPAADNATNTTPIENGNFLLWGDDNAALTLAKGQGADSLLALVARKWLMKATGTTANQIPTELRINLKLLPKEPLGYWLVIDRSGGGNFSTDALEYIQPDKVLGDSIVAFSNVRWDTDGSGSDRFGLARAGRTLPLLTQLANPTCASPAGGRVAVEIVGGQGTYAYQLTGTKNGFSRRWQGTGTVEQTGLPAGSYTLKVTGEDKSTVQRHFTLTAPNALAVDLGQDRQLAAGKEIVLDAGTRIPAVTPVTYTWENNYGFRSKAAQVNITQSGIYTVTVTNAEGCSCTDQVIIGGQVARQFDVSPNLVRSGSTYQVNVSLEEASAARVKVYDTKGVLHGQMQGNDQAHYQFTGTGPQPGAYTVVLETPKGIETRKLVIY
ncbi:MAG: hypothetical protein AVDCRST_MAG56-951 [uncultured Cytophagales bacterium]|uniref:DUF8202 domain-containing protein n=1 Tax=uncultured Cytophagales bacterium TaxID=158755 RepID=A0A6J4HJG1_9SPHI|nr:MAG: hypothetical protein AVDCRST_MAG56-951 [uncultured Cytophagales bacterium]